jgi:hypothetical protein
MKKKTCGKCKKTKPLDCFHKNTVQKIDGHHSTCKPCRIKYNTPRAKVWRRDNLERAKAKGREWHRKRAEQNKLVNRS